jgi:hypothetical protein
LFSPSAPSLSFPDSLTAVAVAARFCYSLPPSVVTIAPARLLLRLLLWPPPPQKEKEHSCRP